MKRNDHKPAAECHSRISLGMVMIAVFMMICVMGFIRIGISEAVTYNMQNDTGTDLNGFTTNYGTCGSNATAPAIVSMNTTAGSNACTSGRSASTGNVDDQILLVISDTVYSQATNITGIDVTGNLRDYQEASPGTTVGIQYQLGYVSGGVFTSFGSADEARDHDSATDWTTDLSAISGTAPLGSRLAIQVLKKSPSGTSYRYYFTSTSLVLNVTETIGSTPGITVNPTSGLTTTEAGGQATFTIVLDSAPTNNVSIGLSSSDTTEGTVSPATVTFTAGNWSTPQTVTVTGVDDVIVDGDIAYTIITAPASSADINYSGMNAADVSVTNLDDDVAGAAGITVNPTSGLITTEAGGQATFTIVLNSAPTANVTIGLSSSDLTEGTVSPASVTFTTGNWSTPQTVTVTGVDDAIQDGNIAYTIVTAAATSGDAGYNGLNASDVSVTNTDNEAAPAVPVGNWPLFIMVIIGMIAYSLLWRRKQGKMTS